MISLGRLVLALQLTSNDSLTEVERMRDAVLSFIANRTGRYFGPVEAFDDVLQGSGSRSLWLTEIPLIGASYEAMTVTEYASQGGSSELIDPLGSEGYTLRTVGNSAKLVRVQGLSWPIRSEFVVHYSRGYAVDGLPSDIEQLAIDLMKFRRSVAGKEGLISESIGGYSYSRPATYSVDDGELRMLPNGVATIEAWRRLAYA